MKSIQITVLIALTLMFLGGCALLNRHDDWDMMENNRQPSSEEIEMHSKRIRSAIEYRDLVPGMSMHEVRAAWGDPADVETAGYNDSGNQKWVYYTGFSSPWSTSPVKIVYFESGQVAGWETVQK